MNRADRADKDRIDLIGVDHLYGVIPCRSTIFAGDTIGNFAVDIAYGADAGVFNHRPEAL